MYANLKAFTIVIVFAVAVFAIGKPLFTRFMTPEDFARRRNLWLLLSAASFLTPSIWLYALVAVPAIALASKKDGNPVALYLFILFAVPPIRLPIPTFGLVGQLWSLDHLRLLSLALLLPLAARVARQSREEGHTSFRNSLTAVDVLVLSYVGLQLLLMVPHESMTSTLRRFMTLFVEILLPYFVVSRACRDRAAIAEAMAAFFVGAVVLVPFEVFEFSNGWMLFAGIETAWEAGRLYFPLHRGSFLRAQATAGHSIHMGYLMAMAFGMWLYLKQSVNSKGWRWVCLLTVMAGLVTPLARGPWIGAVVVYFFSLALGPSAASRSFKGFAVAALVCGIALVSPWGSQIVDYLPYVGTVDMITVTQRESLAAGSWLLIRQNPLFGSANVLAYMEEFRTGEGIIDIVNTYAAVALSFGLVGAALFVGAFLVSLWRTYKLARRLEPVDRDAARMGVALISCLLGTLLVIATVSFINSMPYIAWSLLGLTSAYSRLGLEESSRSQDVASARLVRRAFQ